MHSIILTALATIASSVGLYGLIVTWRRATEAPEQGTILVTHKGTKKSAIIPKEYSHSAVQKMAELAS